MEQAEVFFKESFAQDMNYDYLFVTHLPSFYKVNLYNELAKKLNIFVVFVSSGSAQRTKDFAGDKYAFDHCFLSEGAFENRNKISSTIKLSVRIRSIPFKKLVVNGWDLPEFWAAVLLSGKNKNCLALESLNNNKYKITAFFNNTDWIAILPETFGKKYAKKPFILKAFDRIYKMADRTPEELRGFAGFFNPIIKIINNSDCDLVLYPSQDAVSYQTKKKSLSTIHDLMHRYESHFKEYQNGEYVSRERRYSLMCKYCNGILVDSNVGKKHVTESYDIDEGKVFVLPFVPPLYLLEEKEVDIKSKYDLPDKYLFYPAQFWEHKNHINLLKAVKILKDEGLIANLVLVGSKKNNYKKVLNMIIELGLSNNVFVLGYVSNSDMASLYRNALATTFVSLCGPTNIPPMEALTLGSPLICSNAYAMPEQVGDAAFLVDPKNPRDIAQKIRMFYQDEDLAKCCVQKGFAIIKKYGQKEFESKLESYIQKVFKSDG